MLRAKINIIYSIVSQTLILINLKLEKKYWKVVYKYFGVVKKCFIKSLLKSQSVARNCVR